MSLEEEELDGYIKKKPVVMLYIYGPDCEKCKALNTEFRKAAKTSKEHENDYSFVKINGKNNPGLSTKFKITGYPVVKLFVNGNPINYDGEYTADAMLRFMNKKSVSVSSTITSAGELVNVISGTGLRGILATNNERVLNDYLDYVRDEDDYTFYNTNMEIAKEAIPDIKEDPSFIILKEYDERKAIFSRYGLPKRYFKAFLRTHEYPLVNPCSKRILDYVTEKKDASERTLLMFLHPKDYPELDKVQEEFKKFAQDERNEEYIFVESTIDEGECKSFASENGIRDNLLPALVVVLKKEWKLERYNYQGPFTYEDMKNFFANWKKGSAERTYKSEEPPDKNPGPVYKVVGATFDDIVLDPKTDVMVKFYAPWCGHCKKLAPVYEELAKKLSADKHIKLVEIDATANEIPGVDINGYPTLKFYKADDKKNPLSFDGERTVEGMEKFLKDHSSFKDGGVKKDETKEETKTDL